MFKRHMIMAPEGETSSGSLGDIAEIHQNGDVNENFEDLEYESEASKKVGEVFKDKFKDRIERAKKAKEQIKEEDDKPAKKTEKTEKKEEKKKTEIDILDDKEDLDQKEVKPKEKKAEKKEKEEDDEELVEDSEKTEEQKAQDKKAEKLKIRMSDGLYGIEKDAKVRVKIDGEFQEVPVQELINNYSGKTAWDKKFTEVGEARKQVETLKHEVTQQQSFIKNTVEEVVKHFTDPEGNPTDALISLADKAGHDPYTVWKRALEANLDEVEKLMSMSEPERKAYFLEKKDEFRTKSEEARKAEFTKHEAIKQAVQKVDSLRQAQGVSEEQYLKALDDLESQGLDTTKMSDEQVVDYASLKPHVDAVQDVLEAYEGSIDDTKYSEVVRSLARQLRAKDFTKEQLSEWAKKEFMDEDLKDLQTRTAPAKKSTFKEPVKAPEKYETFADFDDY